MCVRECHTGRASLLHKTTAIMHQLRLFAGPEDRGDQGGSPQSESQAIAQESHMFSFACGAGAGTHCHCQEKDFDAIRHSILGVCTDFGTEVGIAELPHVNLKKYIRSFDTTCQEAGLVTPQLQLHTDSILAVMSWPWPL